MCWNLPVDPVAFVEALPALWDDFPLSDTPRNSRFEEILAEVPGLTRPNNLALLNLAASHLPPDETYVEVGSLRGTSLIAAILDNGDKTFIAIDDFSMGDANRSELERNLARFGAGQATILEGDAFEILRKGNDQLQRAKIGVYYYDAAHTYQQQLDGLRLAEPHLGDNALLIVDDTDWDFVAQATSDYLRDEPRARLLLWLPGKKAGRPAWWEGVQVLAWKRGEGRQTPSE
jgi:Methyltransferase domain